MDLQDRLSYLESVRDWQGLVDELEKGINESSADDAKAAYYLRLGTILETKFLSGVKALKHYQDAYKLNPALLESLAAARGIYWTLGKANMVQKLLELELKSLKDGPQAVELLIELGDVLVDAGDYDKATSTYARAVGLADGTSPEAIACLDDVQLDSGSWQERVESLTSAAANASTAASRSRLLLRAARITKRFAPDAYEEQLASAYTADPLSKQAALLYEAYLNDQNRLPSLASKQANILDGISDTKTRAENALQFGIRWTFRHQNLDVGTKFLEQALSLDYEQEGAFHFLREAHGKKAGNWEHVLTVAEQAAERAGDEPGAAFHLAQAGVIAWRQLSNLIRAKSAFERLRHLAPEHPQLLAFEAQIGSTVTPRASGSPPALTGSIRPQGSVRPPMPSTPPADEAPATPHVEVPNVASVRPSAPPPAQASESVAPPRQPSAAPASAQVGDPSKIAELRALADKQETAKRFNEYVKTLVQLAAIVEDDAEKIALYTKAADLYVTKFANQAEAVKAYEQVVAIDPENAGAIDYLKQMYEKRRDWEKLLGLQRREAERLPAGPARGAKFLEIAKLATERVKKPDVCIELWNEVIANDETNVEALGALGQLYERSKEFDKLVVVLEKQSEVTYDAGQRAQILSKLGTIYGERLNNDEGAVNAWRALLAIDPNDRKAQEALKKKYLTLGRWDDLEVFYAESGKWDEFIRVLEQQEAKETDPQAKLGMLFKIAELWADKKQKADRAAKSYEKILELEPNNLKAAEALIPIYTAASNSKALANAIEVKLSHEEDDFAKVALLREVAALYEGRVKDPEKALERYLSVFALVPSEENAALDVERAAKANNGFPRLVDAFKVAIETSDSNGDRETAVSLRLRLGRIFVEELKQIDDALAAYRAVYDADPDNVPAITALEHLYRTTNNFSELLVIYEKKREFSNEPADRKAIQYEIAKLYETELKDVDKAIETYQSVLDDEPTDKKALLALDALFGQLGRWDEYVDTLRKRIELDSSEQELIDLKFRLGQTLEKHLSDAPGALENYREILFLDSKHDGAREALEALLRDENAKGEAASILESIYEERGDWKKLIAALEVLSGTETDPHKRVQLLRKSARISAEQLSNFGGAFDSLALALKEEPSLAETRLEMEHVAEQAQKWSDLTKLYEEIASGLTDANLARDYWMRLASIFDARLQKIDEAAGAYTKVLALEPGDAPAILALEELFTRTQRWTDLIGVIDRRVEQTSDAEEREALLVRIANIYDGSLGKPEEAIAAYKKVLELDSSNTRALHALDALYTRQKLWSDLAENLEAQLALSNDDTEQLQIMLRLASLREREMNQVEQAIEGYRSVLERDAGSVEALSALERLGSDARYELAIADMLEPLYRQSGNYQKLIGAHEIQVRLSDDVVRRVELLSQISQLHEDATNDVNSAFSTMLRALNEDPANDATQKALERLARATGRYADLAAAYETLGTQKVSSDVALASELTMIAARIFESDIVDGETAIRLYRKVLEIDAENLGAAESLERIFRQTERYADLSLILQQKADIVSETDDKKVALFQAASIEEDVLEKPEAAIAVYRKVLEIDGEDLRAVDALIKRYLGLSRWNDLLEAYSKKADLTAEALEKKSIFFQVGAVYERELRDVSKAVETYQRILEIDPDDVDALARLDLLFVQSENWSELLNVLTRESEMSQDPATGIGFSYRIAALYEQQLGDVPRAIELYRDILERDASHEETLRSLENLKDGDKEPLLATQVLEPVYESASDWRKLVSVLEVQVKVSTDPFQKVELLHRIARLYEDALYEHKGAFDTYARALPFDNANEATLQNLERLAMTLTSWPDVAQLYDAELDKLSETPDRFVELGLRTAQIYEVQLENVEQAIARYRRVMTADSENQTAVRSLDRLYTQTSQWKELAEILVRESEIGQTPDEILEFKHRLGKVYETRLNDLTAAIAAYREVLNAAPEHQGTLTSLEYLFEQGQKQLEIAEILEPLYRQAGEFEKLARVYEAQLEHIPVAKPESGEGLGGEEDRLAAYYRIAELFEEKLVDMPATLDVYIRILKEYPLDEKTGEEAPRLAGGIEQGWETLANAYADVLGMHADPAVQRTIGKRLAKVFEDELGEVDKAEETYKYVLGIDPLDAETLANLDRIYSSLEAWPSLAEVLEMRVKAPADDIELVDLYSRLGEVYEHRLTDVANATVAYRKIFDGLDKTHEGAIAALGRIYESLNAYKELDEVYQRELENASGDVAEAEIRAKIAHLAAEKLGEPDRAIETWKAVLDLRGEDPEALGSLAALYEQKSSWRDLTDVLERQSDIASSDEERVNILTHRAHLFTEKMERDDLALADWNRVLDIDHANLAALRAVAAIRRREGDANELVLALHQIVDRASALLDETELKEVFRELGKTYGEKLEQPFDAADAWRRLLEVGADFEAMDALEAIYRAEERTPDVIDVKMQRAAALEEPSKKIEELRAVAALWTEQAGEPDKATLAWQKILEVDSAHDEAFSELEKLHTSAERWESLIELYLGRLDTRSETAQRTELLRKIARVFEEKLDDKNQALDALINALSEDFHDRETARYLERMAQATGRWGEVIQTANNWLQQQTEPEQKIRLCLHLAKWYGDDLSRPDYAQPYYAQIVQLDPNNVGALRQMAQLYRKNADWVQLGKTLTRALDVAVTDLDRKEILTELGEVLDHQMNQTDQALSYFQRALEVDSHFLPAIENLERIYESRAQNKELVETLTKKVSALTAAGDIIITKNRIGGLYEAMPHEMPKAAQAYRDVLELEATNLQGLRGLARVYAVLEQWSDLVRVLETELEVVTTERERIDILMQLAKIHEEQFLKADIAAQRLEQVVEIDPNHEAAFEALARCYKKQRLWSEFINAAERHISATLERKTKMDLYAAIAQVQEDELDNADAAIDAYRNIVDLDDTNVAALEALAKLYDKQGDAHQSIETMTRVAELTQDTKQRVEAFYRIGKALDEKLGDRVQAQDKYELAIDLDPSHVPSLAALRVIAIDNSDFDKAARYVDQEQSYTTVPRQRARLLVELGKIREEMLGDHESAVLAWQSAHEADPENEEAALPLADEYISREEWVRAEPLLDLLTRKAGKRERAEQHDLQSKLGRVSAALGKDDKALKAYSAAHQLDLTNQDTIRGLAEVSFRLKDWGAALTNFQKVLTALGEEDTEQRAEIYFKLGCVKREQGQAKQAINNFEKALSVDPNHRPTLEALVSVYTELKDWKQVVAYKRQILDSVIEGEERFKLLVEVADIWNDNDKNPSRAIEALEEARELEPDNRTLLHKLLALYEATENWGRMIDTIQALAEMEKDPIRKSKFIFTVAQLYRDKEEDQDRAVDLFNDALDLNPGLLEAFERINKIHTGQKDWKALERAFRKMLRRLSTMPNAGNPELEFNLWHNLGLIYRDRLQDTNSAIEAFKMATRFKPDEPVERQILAELFEVTEQLEAAIGEHSIVLQKDPLRVDPYRSLYKLALRMHDYDRAWCMCAALAFLGKADDEEKRFFEDYRPRGMIQVKSRLDNEHWVKNLFHKDENLFVGKIFEMITSAAILSKTNDLAKAKQLRVPDKKFKHDPATSTVTFAKTFGWAGQVLGVSLPELYLLNDANGGLGAIISRPVASVAGQAVLTGYTPQELTFICGKHLSVYRPEHYIKTLFPSLGDLKVMLFAAIKLVMPEFAVPAEMQQAVSAAAAELNKYMQAEEREKLRKVVQMFIDGGAKVDLKRWMQATEITAARAGLLLCADLEIAKKVIAREPQQVEDVSPSEKMKELLVFSVSEPYLALRKSLGIAVG